MQVGPVLRRAARLVRRIGQEPSLMPPDLEEALDEQLAGSDGAATGDSDGDEGSADDADDVGGHRTGEVYAGGGSGSDEEGNGFDAEGDADEADPAEERWASVLTSLPARA